MEGDALAAAGADLVRCSCGATFPRSENVATHRYIRSAPECWAAFGEVLAREYENPVLFGPVHQLTVDAYAVQHPESQSAKSLVSHLVSLYSILERDGAGPVAIKAFVEGRREFPTLVTPWDLGSLTIADVAAAAEPDTHRDTVRHWARQVWGAWSGEHSRIAALFGPRGSPTGFHSTSCSPPTPHSSHIRSGLRELRCHYGRKANRVLPRRKFYAHNHEAHS